MRGSNITILTLSRAQKLLMHLRFRDSGETQAIRLNAIYPTEYPAQNEECRFIVKRNLRIFLIKLKTENKIITLEALTLPVSVRNLAV